MARVAKRIRLIAAAIATMLIATPGFAADPAPLYGLLGRMIAQPGQRDALIAILLEGSGSMPGCRSYIVAKDMKDANAIWVTEVWDSKESHAASLKLPTVQAAIAKGRPLIAGFDSYTETIPIGGVATGR